MSDITTLEALHALYGTPAQASTAKVADHLTAEYRAWIETARFCVLSTIGPEGTDASPRGDDGPVVRVHDPRVVLMPDWRGNNRLDSLRNIVRDPRVSLMFMVPGSNNVIRLNGRAYVSDDADLLASFARGSLAPRSVIRVELGEIYFQCARALKRSALWSRNDAAGLPSPGDFLDVMTKGEINGAEYDSGWAARATKTMW